MKEKFKILKIKRNSSFRVSENLFESRKGEIFESFFSLSFSVCKIYKNKNKSILFKNFNVTYPLNLNICQATIDSRLISNLK